MFGKIWERYFIKEVSKAFLFCFFGAYALYVIVDYASRSGIYRAIHVSFLEIAAYYFSILIQRLDIFVPFAFLIATIHTLCHLNVHNELIALMASGLPLKRLLKPFLLFGFLLTFVLYLNVEYFLPRAMEYHRVIEDAHFIEKYKSNKNTSLHSISLNDGSMFLYHYYDSIKDTFHDVYWLRTIDDMFHMKSLVFKDKQHEGRFVNHLLRTSTGELISTEAYPEMTFPNLHISKKALSESTLSPQSLPFSKLWRSMISFTISHDKQAQIATAFYYKLAMPWLAMLAFLAPATFCLKFTRQLPVFFIYLGSIVGMVAFYLIMHAAFILGEYQTLIPLAAIFVPFALISSPFIYLYHKNI